jgi:hypothetical protein
LNSLFLGHGLFVAYRTHSLYGCRKIKPQS